MIARLSFFYNRPASFLKYVFPYRDLLCICGDLDHSDSWRSRHEAFVVVADMRSNALVVVVVVVAVVAIVIIVVVDSFSWSTVDFVSGEILKHFCQIR